MRRMSRFLVVLGVIAAGIAVIGTAATFAQNKPTTTGNNDTGLARPALGL